MTLGKWRELVVNWGQFICSVDVRGYTVLPPPTGKGQNNNNRGARRVGFLPK